MGRQDDMHPAEAFDTRLTYDDYLQTHRLGEFSREEGHLIQTPLLPGLRISLEELFR